MHQWNAEVRGSDYLKMETFRAGRIWLFSWEGLVFSLVIAVTTPILPQGVDFPGSSFLVNLWWIVVLSSCTRLDLQLDLTSLQEL